MEWIMSKREQGSPVTSESRPIGAAHVTASPATLTRTDTTLTYPTCPRCGRPYAAGEQTCATCRMVDADTLKARSGEAPELLPPTGGACAVCGVVVSARLDFPEPDQTLDLGPGLSPLASASKKIGDAPFRPM